MLKQGECQKLSLKVLEACQQVCLGPVLGLFNSYASICSIPWVLLALAYMPNPSFYDVKF